MKMDVRFKHPFTCTVSGPTRAGKSVFTFRLIDEAKEQITPRLQQIVYCYGVYQSVFSKYLNIKFNEVLPDDNDFDGQKKTFVDYR